MNTLKTTFLLTCLTLLLIAMGSAIGGQTGMIIAFLIAGGMNFFSYWYSDKIVLKMYKAKEVSESENPSFYNMVKPACPAGEYADAEGLHYSFRGTECFCYRTQPRECGCRSDRRNYAPSFG